MNKFNKFGFCKVSPALALAFLGASSIPAHAYLDPGTGSMILQLLLGGLAGLALVGKLYWAKLLSLFSTQTKPNRTEKSAEDRRDVNADT